MTRTKNQPSAVKCAYNLPTIISINLLFPADYSLRIVLLSHSVEDERWHLQKHAGRRDLSDVGGGNCHCKKSSGPRSFVARVKTLYFLIFNLVMVYS